MLDRPEVHRTACSGWARLTGRRRPGRQLAVGLHLSRRIASVPVTGPIVVIRAPVGVQRQYSGTAGRIENSQVGVFLGYASVRGRR